MSKFIFIPISIVTVVGIVALYGFSTKPDGKNLDDMNKRTSSHDGSLESIRETGKQKRQSMLINGKLRSLDNRISRLEQAPTESDDTDDEPESLREFDTASSTGKSQMGIERLTRIDDSFHHETRDSQWADNMERTLNAAFDSGAFEKTKMLSNNCRSTFCRMEVAHDDIDGKEDFERIGHASPGGFYMQHLQMHEDGSSNTVVFFMRKDSLNRNPIYQMMQNKWE